MKQFYTIIGERPTSPHFFLSLKSSILLAVLLAYTSVMAQQRSVIISEIFFDTPLEERYFIPKGTHMEEIEHHHNGEYFELTNTTGSPIFIGSWKITNSVSSYTLPANTALGPYGSMIIAFRNDPEFQLSSLFPHVSESESKILYQDRLYWRNRADYFYLTNPAGMIIDSGEYTSDSSSRNNRIKSGVNGTMDAHGCLALHRTQESILNATAVYRAGVPSPHSYIAGSEGNVGDLGWKMPKVTQIANQNSDFSTMPVSSFVSSTGAAAVDIPLNFPGSGAPNLSLRYNSQSDIGMFGLGAELIGLSSISLTMKTLYQDGIKLEPQNDGPFSLDGVRLYEIENTPMQYKTEKYNDCSIEKQPTGGFKVRSISGLLAEYGTTEDSRMKNSVGATVAYRLARIVDEYGNQKCYYYNGYYLDRIEYGGAENIVAPAIITFSYELNNDLPRTQRIARGELILNKKVVSINITYDGISLTKYHFLYDGARLTKVIESAHDGKEISTSLNWGNYIPQIESVFKQGQIRNMRVVASGDFDGDGYIDVLKKDSESFIVYSIKKNGSFLGSFSSVEKDNADETAVDEMRSCFFMDIDEDGCDELIIHVQPTQRNIHKSHIRYLKYNPQGNNFEKELNDPKFILGVFDDLAGNFKVEFQSVPNRNKSQNDLYAIIGRYVARIDVVNKAMMPRMFINAPEGVFLQESQLIDLYSNGESQLLWRDQNNYWRINSLTSGSLIYTTSETYYTASVLDANQDGQQDIMFFRKYILGKIYINKSGSFTIKESNINCNMLNLPGVLMVDKYLPYGFKAVFVPTVNKIDSKLEYLLYYSAYEGSELGGGLQSGIVVLRSVDGITWEKTSRYVQKSNISTQVCFGNFISENSIDVFFKEFPKDEKKQGYTLFYQSKSDQAPPSLLSSISQNDEVIAKFSYQGSAPPHQPEKRVNPLSECMVLRAPVLTVKSLYGKNESGGYSTKKYIFDKGIVHTRGMGFLGFTTIQCNDNVLGASTITSTFGYNGFPYLKIQDTQTQSIRTEQSFEFVRLSDKYPIHVSRLFNQFVRKFSDYSWTASNYIYDAQHRLIFERTLTKDNINSTRELLDYSERNQPGREIVTIKYPSSSDFTQETLYSYSSQGSLTQKCERANTDMPITTSYAYNSRGQMIREATTAPAVESVVTEYLFCPKTLRLLSKKTALSETKYEYQPYTGFVLSKEVITGPHSFKTEYKYDSWGNVVFERNPYGRETSISWGWGSADGKKTAYCHSIRRTTGLADVVQGYDRSGFEIYSSSEVGDVKVQQYTGYDARGRTALKVISYPYLEKWQETSYDNYNRPTMIVSHTDNTEFHTYSGMNVKSENSAGRVFERSFDTQGNLLKSTEPLGGTVAHTYHSSGNRQSSQAVGSSPVTVEYDKLGRRIALNDPNAGLIRLKYDAYDRIIAYESPTVSYSDTFDQFGRISSRSYDSGEAITYTYVHGAYGHGQLAKVAHSNGYSELYTYNYRALCFMKKILDNNKLKKSYRYGYNKYGDIYMEQTTGMKKLLYYTFSSIGELVEVKYGDIPIWTRLEKKPGNKSKILLGNGLTMESLINNKGAHRQLSLAQGGSVVWRQNYQINLQTGNVDHRREEYQGKVEEEFFTYDNQDRLLSMTMNGATVGLFYEPSGRIISKGNVGKYQYDSSRPHAVTGLTTLVNEAAGQPLQTIEYNNLRKIQQINQEGYSQQFVYGVDDERVKSELFHNKQLIRQIEYGDRYEKVVDASGNIVEYYYLCSTPETEVLLVTQNGEEQLYYVQKDLVGSWVVITDGEGTVVDRHSFDAWGKRRCGDTCQTFSLFRRGYGGHEEMPEFGLINMNGRVYDPLFAMFLSPDPYIQAPDFSQSYNRYGYCLNNPLKYTDPSGEFWHIVIGAAIGGVINLAANSENIDNNVWKGVGYFAIGAVSGGLGAGIGTGLSSSLAGGSFAAGFVGSASAAIPTTSFVSGAIIAGGAGASGGFVNGLGNGLLNKETFGTALGQGFISAGIGLGSGVLVGGIAGGISALRDGRGFWEGDHFLERHSLPDGNLPIHMQENPSVGCTQETFESIMEYKKTPITVADKTNGADFRVLAEEYNVNTETFTPERDRILTVEDLCFELRSNNPVAITYKNGGTYHTVGINSVEYRAVPKLFTNQYTTRKLIQVMDPLSSSYKYLSLRNYDLGTIRVLRP